MSQDMSRAELEDLIAKVEKQMRAAAAELNFEMAAELRDRMIELKENLEDVSDTERRVRLARKKTEDAVREQPKRTYKTYNKARRKNRGGMA